MSETNNLAIQTFLDVQQVKAMFQFAKISIWEANMQFDLGKPVTYQNKLYITALSHLSGSNFDITKFNSIEASSIDPSNIPVSSTSFSGRNLVEVLGELLNMTQSVSPSNVPVSSANFTSTNLGGVLTELYNASHTVSPSRVPVSSANFTSTDLGGVLTELYNASHTVSPSRVPVSDSKFTSTDLGGALVELYNASHSVPPSRVPISSSDFTSTDLGGALTELLNASKTIAPSRVPVSSANFTSTDLGGVLTELYNASHSVPPSRVPVSSTNFTSTDLGGVLTELYNASKTIAPSRVPVSSSNFTSTDLGGVLTELYNAIHTIALSRVSVSDSNFTSTDLGGALTELYNASHSVPTSRVPVSDSNFVSTTLAGVLDELFQSASNGKSAIATAITGKGGVALSSNTFTQLATAISNLASGGSALSKVTKLNVSAPYTKTIVLTNARSIDNLCVLVLDFQQSTGVSQYLVAFNNGDSSNFTFDSSYVQFDGYMKLKDTYSDVMADSGVLGIGHLYTSPAVTVSNFNSVESFTATESVFGYVAVPKAQIIKANADINLTGVESLDSISDTCVSSGGGSALMAISVDAGTTFKTYNGSAWVTVDTTSVSDFKSKGMSKSSIEGLSSSVLGTLRGVSNTMRFAYLLERPTYAAVAYNDQLQLLVTMPGYYAVADKSKYTTSYDAGTKTISVVFATSGTYTINYAD